MNVLSTKVDTVLTIEDFKVQQTRDHDPTEWLENTQVDIMSTQIGHTHDSVKRGRKATWIMKPLRLKGAAPVR